MHLQAKASAEEARLEEEMLKQKELQEQGRRHWASAAPPVPGSSRDFTGLDSPGDGTWAPQANVSVVPVGGWGWGRCCRMGAGGCRC